MVATSTLSSGGGTLGWKLESTITSSGTWTNPDLDVVLIQMCGGGAGGNTAGAGGGYYWMGLVDVTGGDQSVTIGGGGGLGSAGGSTIFGSITVRGGDYNFVENATKRMETNPYQSFRPNAPIGQPILFGTVPCTNQASSNTFTYMPPFLDLDDWYRTNQKSGGTNISLGGGVFDFGNNGTGATTANVGAGGTGSSTNGSYRTAGGSGVIKVFQPSEV